MSRASAYVVKLDGEFIGHCVYSGTSDVLGPNIAESSEAAWEYDDNRASRIDGRNAWDALSECDHEPEQGYVYSDYGGGFYWPASFCRQCMVVIGPLSPYVQDYGYSYPTPEQQARDDAWHAAGWPKDGEPPIEGTTSQRQLPEGES